jgi:nucleotide-binding universal stress UspA family protein
MSLFHRLTVALARQPADAGLVRYAALASRLGGVREICLVHVLAPQAGGPASTHADAEVSLRTAGAEEFARAAPSATVRTAVLSGPLTDRLLSFIAESQTDLVMVGHGAGHSGRRALARRLAMKAPCSVWMVPDGAPPNIGRILTPIDFSPHSADTMQTALSLARASGAACLPLHVYFNEAVVTYEEYDQVLRGQERDAYDQFIAPLDTRGVELSPIFEEGASAPHVIERVAQRESADLIVMGTRGRSRSAAILLGSVTEQTLLETRLPLLAVKHFGARMSVLQALLDRGFLYRSGLRTD